MKLYYYYGVMNSSKTANALMKKFNFEQHGRKVALLKPSVDMRYGKTIVKSRIGLSSEAFLIDKNSKIRETILSEDNFEIIIADEAQFFTENQIDELRCLASNNTMVMCYGLKTNYMGKLFEGSKRLIEVCDTMREIPSMCTNCGRKAIINARFERDEIICSGDPIDIGGEDKYLTLCHQCWQRAKLTN